MYKNSCIEDSDKYVQKILTEFPGLPTEIIVDKAVFSTFNHLYVYFPEAYKHMLKVWGISDENN